MKLDWKSGLGFGLSAVLLWWTLRDVSPTAVWEVLRHSSVPMFALAVVVNLSIFPLRARRWRTILEPVAGRIPFGPLWRSTAIGIMMNNVFPLRAGEFARAFALTREVPRVAITTSFGSLAVDRIFDAIAIFGFMFVAMLDPTFPSGISVGGRTVPQLAGGGIVAVLGVLAISFAMVMQHERVMAMVGAIAGKVTPKHRDTLVRIVGHGLGGLAVLKDGKRFLAVLWWAALHWFVQALSLYLGFRAVGIDVPFSAALFLQGIQAIGVAIPSSPGFFGVFETASIIGLDVYGVPKELAVSWALGFHILTFIPITVIGAVYFARLGLSVGSIQKSAKSEPTA